MINYRLSKALKGIDNVTVINNQYTFGYPCSDSLEECTPYTVNLMGGTYLIEAWGSAGQAHVAQNAIPGLGGYSSGVLVVKNSLTLYLYIGSISFFNSMFIYVPSSGYFFGIGGGSSDVLIKLLIDLILSHSARVFWLRVVGGSEWANSKGGHGGGLEGGKGYSPCWEASCQDSISGGGIQTSGGKAAQSYNEMIGIKGLFGMSPVNYNSADMGGIGGNGYYSGGSIEVAGAGGGGSSFISGYEGCVALNSSLNENPSPTNSSIHYSGIKFFNPTMIQGNNEMPLFINSGTINCGIGNKNRGAIRITIISGKKCTENLRCQNYLSFLLITLPNVIDS
ncbi:hypothetical protein TVAG_339140 [Trichomonas vaginalis G3]|uniref:receptor protein-tyrosine kinase n=1 Tax=Trichomonas vaginalis (strain ATCC PRA-98 / G3) TaxID=412133 RepID=A2FMS7_TRIV3|nr:glycine-rich protein family [Trichomonas vaginalis G3]EAX93791.1 hypothetical protein TVAG_339140 [Trichomonas vaginalis G3]KAI5527838.1 glycine-rich protein family [Trichomonas vaginalis G3]|eukprot:XP_001306721.1 hypothetical protein [Trichomonas vaginalis G3]